MELNDMTLDVDQQIEVMADIADVFKGVLKHLGEGNVRPDGQPLNMIIEPWAGGRWFRDRGEGIQHLWGHVQVIKLPTLIEVSGPMFMSYPAINHLEVKLDQIAGGTKITLRHRAFGFIDPEHREGVSTGWHHLLEAIKNDFAGAARGTSQNNMPDDMDIVWKALSDPTRRAILDLLRNGAKTTTEIVEAFPEMTRHAVMKHIDVLRQAGLVNTREEGRLRVNSLNPVPIRRIYERWMGPFTELWSSTLLRIKDDVEGGNKKKAAKKK